MADYAAFHTEELLAFMKKDDRNAFTEIYHRFWKKMLTVAVNKLGDLTDAEEVVQEIFIALWNRRKELCIQSSLSNYLAVSVKYRVLKYLNKQYHRQQYLDSVVGHPLDNSTQEWIQFNELYELLALYINDLPDKCKLVYQLSREQGYSQKQIAAELNISEKTVEAHLTKATRTLRTKLTHYMYLLL